MYTKSLGSLYERVHACNQYNIILNLHNIRIKGNMV